MDNCDRESKMFVAGDQNHKIEKRIVENTSRGFRKLKRKRKFTELCARDKL